MKDGKVPSKVVAVLAQVEINCKCGRGAFIRLHPVPLLAGGLLPHCAEVDPPGEGDACKQCRQEANEVVKKENRADRIRKRFIAPQPHPRKASQ